MSRLIVGDLPRVNAERQSDEPAYIQDERTVTWAAVDARVNSLAHVLLDHVGHSAGETIAILSANRIECIELMFAASRAALIHTALNIRSSVQEMLRQLDDSQARTLIVGPGFDAIAKELQAARPDLGLLGLPDACVGEDLEDLQAQASSTPIPSHQDPDATYSIMYTSGSTGEPKGVAISSRNEFAYSWTVSWAVDSRHDDIVLHVLPLFHRGGQFFAMTFALLGRPVVLGAPDPVGMLELVAKHDVTGMMFVPTIGKMMVEAIEAEPQRFHLSSLQRLYCGSAALSPDLARRLVRATSATLCQVGGSSEGAVTMALTARDYAQILSEPALEHRIWSVGRSAPGVRVRIVDELDNDVPPGAIGELVYQGDQFVNSYWRKPDVTAAAWRNGWFHSGDLGYRDDDGYIYYKDRLFGRIKSGAETIFSREVEIVLEGHPAVAEVAVVGLPDDHWGEAVTAVVVLCEESSSSEQRASLERELSELVANELARYKIPKRFVVLDSLPRTALGKVAYGELKQALVSKL